MIKDLPNDRSPAREELVTPKLHDASHERDARCVPLAHTLIKLLAIQPEMPVGAHVNEKLGETDPYIETVHQFLKELIEKDVKVQEVTYIFALAREGLEFVQSAIDNTLNNNMNRNTEAMYGLEHNEYNNVTVKNLNTVVMRRHLIADMWKPILEAPVENTEVVSDTGVDQNQK